MFVIDKNEGSREPTVTTPIHGCDFRVVAGCVLVMFIAAACQRPADNSAAPHFADTPQDARQPTPVRLTYCTDTTKNDTGSDCTVFARYKDLADCEYYKVFFTSLCDSRSEPGRITCDTTHAIKARGALDPVYCLPE